MENRNKINITTEKLIKYIDKRCFYKNIFLFIKLCNLQYYSQRRNKNSLLVPDNLMKIFNEPTEELTFLQITGCLEIANKHGRRNNVPSNLIFIPKDFITQFFTLNETMCCGEKEFVKNKVDLYFSILTYIYIHTFSLQYLRENFHDDIISYMKKFLTPEEEEEDILNKRKNIILSLYNSVIYNFSQIPNDLESFHYKFSDIKLNIYEHYNHYNSNEYKNPNPLYLYCILHHLITIFRFYNDYVLSYFTLIHNATYKIHPLENVREILSKNY